jgi:hypothetical protein
MSCQVLAYLFAVCLVVLLAAQAQSLANQRIALLVDPHTRPQQLDMLPWRAPDDISVRFSVRRQATTIEGNCLIHAFDGGVL